MNIPIPGEGDKYMKKDSKKENLRRLKIIEGHLKKVILMMEEDKYCIDILQQSLAVQNALREVDGLILDNHLRDCVTRAFQKKGGKEKVITELLDVLKRNRK